MFKIKTFTLCVLMIPLFSGCIKNATGIVISSDGLVLRSGPSANTDNIANMPLGSMILIRDTGGPKETLYGITGNWYKISYSGKEGWAFGGLIKQLKSDLSGAYRSSNNNHVIFYEYKNNEFEMVVNLCEGMGAFSGNYQHDAGTIKCQVTKTDFSGFRGDRMTNFNFTRINNKSIVYEGEGIGCDPNRGDVLTKF